MWIRPLEPKGGKTISESKHNYLKYCVKEGQAIYSKGTLPRDLYSETINLECGETLQVRDNDNWVFQWLEREPSIEVNPRAPKKQTKTSDIIKDQIINGAKRLELTKKFPQMARTIKDCLELHPVKYQSTDCMYLFGPTGAGKTTTTKRVLDYFRDVHGINYYSKMGGLSKFFDGYDWQPIILIDDPIAPDAKQNGEQIQMFKTIINEHHRIIEIKGGSMPMDTGLIIITANITPLKMANACGEDCADAVYRRLTKPPGSFNVRKQDREKLTRLLISVICQRFDFDLDQEIIYRYLKPVETRQYDLTAWFGTREMSPIRTVHQECINILVNEEEVVLSGSDSDSTIPYLGDTQEVVISE